MTGLAADPAMITDWADEGANYSVTAIILFLGFAAVRRLTTGCGVAYINDSQPRFPSHQQL